MKEFILESLTQNHIGRDSRFPNLIWLDEALRFIYEGRQRNEETISLKIFTESNGIIYLTLRYLYWVYSITKCETSNSDESKREGMDVDFTTHSSRHWLREVIKKLLDKVWWVSFSSYTGVWVYGSSPVVESVNLEFDNENIDFLIMSLKMETEKEIL